MNNRQQSDEHELTILIIYSWREVWKLFSLLLAILLALILIVHDVNAGTDTNTNAYANAYEVEMSQVKSGTLLFKSEHNHRYQVVPTLQSDVKVEVTGMIARTTLRQQFKNNQNSWVEGIYVFPLPEDAAVDRLRMQIGERTIEGEIKERQEAKRIYHQARAQGKKVSLIEQERPNLFTNSVANIGPGETVVVEIEYQQTLRYDNGAFSLRFPMAITPRYIPGDPAIQAQQTDRFDGNGWAVIRDQVSDASRITPPIWRGEGKTDPEKINPVRLTVVLNSGFNLDHVESLYHPINTKNIEQNRVVVTLVDGEMYAERDFELVWRPASDVTPTAALFTEEKDGDLYHLLMVLPPRNINDGEVGPSETGQIDREVIYVIDTSGSMSGVSIKQARQALMLALKRLRPDDRFNVIAFNSHTDKLFLSARRATAQNLRVAQRYVSSLEADGGTEIRAALEAALLNQGERIGIRQVIFLTDGSVGNEAALFKLINQHLGNSRLFTIGIGAAPNSHFMSKAAQFGRGTFTYIGDVNEVQSKMSELFQKLETTVMSNVKAEFDDPDVEMWPQRLPDLYRGEPLMLTARTKVGKQTVVISGQDKNQIWRNTLSLEYVNNRSGIAALWARNKIAALMDRLHEGDKVEQIKPQVIAVALQHHLVSKYTSLVAVDKTPSRPDSEELNTQALAVNLPHGQIHKKIFGRHAQTATPAQLQLMLGAVLLLIALWIWRSGKIARVRQDA